MTTKLVERKIRLRFGAGLSAEAAFHEVELALGLEESAELWLLRGHYIQLSDEALGLPEEPGEPLSEVRRSYERALELEPENPEPYEELGRYFELEQEPLKAREYYRLALQRGAREDCARALRDLERELRET